MPYDIAKIFSDNGIIQDTGGEDVNEGLMLSKLVMQGPAAVAAARLPKVARQVGSSLGGMLGLDTRDKNEVLAEQLKGADLSTVDGVNRAAALIEKTHGGTAALGWKSQMLQRLQENKQKQQQLDTQAADAESAATRRTQQTALETAKLAETVRTNEAGTTTAPHQRYKVSGDNVFDTVDQRWLQPPTAGLTMPELEKIDPDAYDPQSVTRFRTALREAKSQAEIDAAGNFLRPKLTDGYAWEPLEGAKDAFGNQSYVQRPTGAKKTEVVKSVRGANEAGRQQREQSAHVVTIMDKMIDSVKTGDTATGMKGIFLQVVPGTSNYALAGDLDVVLANLGYDALLAAKASSDSGASGFGQLTEKELRLLQQLEQDLKVGLDRDTLVERLSSVRNTFEDAGKRAKTDWTIDQYIGIEKPPAADDAYGDNAIEAERAARAARRAGVPQ